MKKILSDVCLPDSYTCPSELGNSLNKWKEKWTNLGPTYSQSKKAFLLEVLQLYQYQLLIVATIRLQQKCTQRQSQRVFQKKNLQGL